MTGTEGGVINLNATREMEFENTWATANSKPQAEALAFNYAEANGAVNGVWCFVSCYRKESSSLILGQNATTVSKGCRDLNDLKVIDTGSKEYREGNIIISGTGGTLTIPVTAQGSANRAHVIKLFALNNAPNSGSAKAFEASIVFASLSSVNNPALLSSSSEVSSVSGSGTNLIINLGSSFNGLRIKWEVVSQDAFLVDIENSTLAT